jgi:hypothetical protein
MVQRATHGIAPQSYGDGAIEEADLSTYGLVLGAVSSRGD